MKDRTGMGYGVSLAAFGVSLVALATACSGSTTSSGTTSTALSSAIASTSASTGTLLCAPAQAQIDACSGATAGEACSLSLADGGTAVSGTCRTTIDGATIACAPSPPAAPQALVEACSGKTSGDTCQAAEAFGNAMEGVCTTAPDGTTLVCGRIHTPPQAAIDACSGQTAGDSCTMPSHADADTVTGVCSLGPASTGPLACAPPQAMLPNAESACSGLSAGATCTIGRGHDTASGTCVTPAAGGSAVCVVACSALGGPFDCGPGGPHGPGDPGHS